MPNFVINAFMNLVLDVITICLHILFAVQNVYVSEDKVNLVFGVLCKCMAKDGCGFIHLGWGDMGNIMH